MTPSKYTTGIIQGNGGLATGNNVVLISSNGVPVDGVSGTGVGFAGKGSLASDYVNGKLYINTGTITSPTWIVAGTQL